MKKDELIITFILTALLLAGSAFHFYNLGGKDAEVFYVRGDTTPFDALGPEVTPTVPSENPINSELQNTPAPSSIPIIQPTTMIPQQAAVLQWLNHASAEDLKKISGIGEQTAANIITFRQQHNGFRSIDQLIQINGIGDKRAEDIVSYIQQSFRGPPAIINRTMSDTNSKNQSETSHKKISINQATAEQLQIIHGIGPNLSQIIVFERTKHNGEFRSWNQLRNISGLGAARIELLQQHFTLE